MTVEVFSKGLKSLNEFNFEDRISALAKLYRGRLISTSYKRLVGFYLEFYDNKTDAIDFTNEINKRCRVWNITSTRMRK